MDQRLLGNYINLFTDFGFKRVFGSEFNKPLLIDFLNQMLEGKEQVKKLTFINPEKLGRTKQDRNAVFDLHCENELGEKFIIELQNIRQPQFKDRSVFYSMFPILDQGIKGDNWDYGLKAVYMISILNFSLPQQKTKLGKPQYLRKVQLMDIRSAEVFYDKLTYIYIEIGQFDKNAHELSGRLEKWVYLIKNIHQMKYRPKGFEDPLFDQLFNQTSMANLNKKDMNAYEYSLKIYRDNKNAMKGAKDEARKEGLEEGLKEGLEKGLEKGKLEGKVEGVKEGFDIATAVIQCLNKGMSIEETSKSVDAPLDFVQKTYDLLNR